MGIFAKIAGKIRAAFRKILKTSVRMVLTPFALAGDIIDWIWTRKTDEEFVEDAGATTIAEAGAQDVVQETRSYTPKRPSLAHLIKRACELREAGHKQWEDVFDWNSSEEIFAAEYVGSLSDTHLVNLRNMATWRLSDHLDTDCSCGRVPSFLHFDADAYAEMVMEKDRLKRLANEREAQEIRAAIAAYDYADPELLVA